MNNQENLFGGIIGRRFIYLDEVSSTNDYLKENLTELPDGTLVAARYQTGGKGTRGRSWSAGADKCLMFSVLLKDLDFSLLSCLPLIAGLSVCEALKKATGAKFSVKWPNDIVTGGKKLCGILCESRLSGSCTNAIIGIGINLLQTEDEFACHDLVYATSLLLATGTFHESIPLAAKIAACLEENICEYKKIGFAADLRKRYKSHCITLERDVLLLENGCKRTAFVRDVMEDGSLLCEFDGKQRQFYSGEVSVRGLYGYI